MKYSPQVSSSVVAWGRPIGPTGCHRRTSFTTASIYGKRERSATVGSWQGPKTRSISFCALPWTSGCSVIARKKHSIAHTVWRNLVKDQKRRCQTSHGISTTWIKWRSWPLGNKLFFRARWRAPRCFKQVRKIRRLIPTFFRLPTCECVGVFRENHEILLPCLSSALETCSGKPGWDVFYCFLLIPPQQLMQGEYNDIRSGIISTSQVPGVLALEKWSRARFAICTNGSRLCGSIVYPYAILRMIAPASLWKHKIQGLCVKWDNWEICSRLNVFYELRRIFEDAK